MLKITIYILGCVWPIIKGITRADLIYYYIFCYSECEKNKNSFFKHKVWWSRKWASEEKGRDRFFHPNFVAAVTALPGCATSVWGGRVSAWQAVSGLVSLQEEDSESRGQNLHHSLLAGGKSGSRWGVGLPPPELHPSNPWEVEEATPAASSCQPARQRKGEPGTEDRRWRGEKRDEPARREELMTRGCRCELSWETNVQQTHGVKRHHWVEAGSAALHVWVQQRLKVCFCTLQTRNTTVSQATSMQKYSAAPHVPTLCKIKMSLCPKLWVKCLAEAGQ